MASDNTLKQLEQILKNRQIYRVRRFKNKRDLDIDNATVGDIFDLVGTLITDLRKQGIPVYFSIDTGPSVVLLTRTKFTKAIIENLINLNDNFNINVGKIGGPSKLLKKTSPEAKFLIDDLINLKLT